MFLEVFHYRDRTTVGNKIGTHLSRGKKANNAVFPVETREWASSCTYTHVHVRSTRPRNHRGQLEILTEHEFMTVSSVYVARERPSRNNKDGQREMVHAEREQEVSKGTWWMRGTEPRNEEEGARNSKRKDKVREHVYVVVRRETRREEFRWRKMEEEGERRKKVVWRRVFREGPSGVGMANGGAVRPTQTGRRFKTLRAAYSLFPFFLLSSRPRRSHLPSSGLCNTLAFTSKRPVHVFTHT